VLAQARDKHQRKGCDLLFANPIDRPGSGFASATNQGWLLGPGAAVAELDPAPKLAIAHQLLSALGALLDAPLRPPADARPLAGPAAAGP